MLIVLAHVVTKEGKGAEFIAAAQSCIQATRQEEGNISYTLVASTENDCNFTFVEEWESQDHLNKHVKTEHFAQLGKSLSELSAAPLVINVYEGNKKN